MPSNRVGLAALIALLGCGRTPSCGGWHGSPTPVRWMEYRLEEDDRRPTVCSPRVVGQPHVQCERTLTAREAARALSGLSAPPLDVALVRDAVAGSNHALDLLEEAGAGRSPRIWNAVGMAHAQRAAREGSIRPYFRALQAFSQALRRDPAYRPAFFNANVVLAHLGLAEAAARGWREYLAGDDDDGWNSEAHVRLQEAMRLSHFGPGPRAFTAGLRAHVAFLDPDSALERWGASLGERARTMASWDDLCRNGVPWAWTVAGQQLAAHFGDALVAGTNQWLSERCLAGRAGDEDRRLAAEVLAGVPPERGLADPSAHGPLGLWHELTRANGLVARGQYEPARVVLEGLRAPLTRERLPGLLARAHWILGTIALRRGRSVDAVQHYSAGLDAVAGGSSPKTAAILRSLIADALALAGDLEEAWREGSAGLQEARVSGARQAVFSTCNQLASVAAAEEDWPTSLLYQDCAVENVAAATSLTQASDVFVWRALCHHHLSANDAAERDLTEAMERARLIEDTRERRHAEAVVQLVGGFVRQATAPERAAHDLEAAAHFFETIGHGPNLFLASLGRLDVARQRGQPREVERLLRAVEAQFSVQMHDTSSPLALFLLGRGAAVSDRRVSFELQRGDAAAAAAATDRARLRGAEQPLSPRQLRELARALPPDTVVLTWAWRRGRVAGFALRRDRGVEALPAPGVLDPKAVLTLGSGGEEPRDWEAACRSLSSALVHPALDALQGAAHVVVVPDGPLFSVPFALLRDREGRPLVESRTVTVATDLRSLALAPRHRWSLHAAKSMTVLVDPGRGPRAPGFQPLPGARGEARHILETLRLPDQRVFEGQAATATRFLDALRSRDIVHFGGHAVADATAPLRSHLLFAPDAAHPSGALAAEDLYGLPTPRAGLVVLAACGSASSGPVLPQGLAAVRPLLDSGVVYVVGAVGVIDDHVVARLMGDFYGGLAEGRSPTVALRDAQVRCFRRGPPAAASACGLVQLFGKGPMTLHWRN